LHQALARVPEAANNLAAKSRWTNSPFHQECSLWCIRNAAMQPHEAFANQQHVRKLLVAAAYAFARQLGVSWAKMLP
jgi:hypothetical protein